MPLKPGDTLGHFRIVEAIGDWEAGDIFSAVDTRSDEVVAIKIAEPPSKDARHWLKEQSKAAKLLTHPAWCAVYEIVEVSNRYGVVFEHPHGEPIINAVPFPPREIVQYASEVARALQFAHQRGLAHFDLSPQNVLLTTDHHVKIMDFGAAELYKGPSPRRKYMAPEELRGEYGDHRADVFAFGSFLFEMTTGRRVFGPEKSPKLFYERIRSELNSAMPSTLNQLIEGSLRVEPEARVSTGQIVEELSALLEHTGTYEPAQPSTRSPQLSRRTQAQKPASGSRNLNAWLERGELPFRVNEVYTIGVNIGARRDGLASASFIEPDWGDRAELNLLISLHGLDVEVVPAWQPLTLRRTGDSATLLFDVKPLAAGEMKIHISVFLAREMTLLEEVRFAIEVVSTEVVQTA